MCRVFSLITTGSESTIQLALRLLMQADPLFGDSLCDSNESLARICLVLLETESRLLTSQTADYFMSQVVYRLCQFLPKAKIKDYSVSLIKILNNVQKSNLNVEQVSTAILSCSLELDPKVVALLVSLSN